MKTSENLFLREKSSAYDPIAYCLCFVQRSAKLMNTQACLFKKNLILLTYS